MVGPILLLVACTSDVDTAGSDSATAAPGFDLTSPEQAVLRLVQTIELRFLLHHHELGLPFGDDLCPTEDTAPPETTYSGDCTTDEGVTYEGQLTREQTSTDDPEVLTYTATGWSVVGATESYPLLGLDGQALVTSTIGTARTLTYDLSGTLVQDISQLGPGTVPVELTGTYRFEGAWPTEGPEQHQFTADLEADGWGHYSATILLNKIEGPCNTFADTSVATIASGDHEVVLEIGDDPDPCDLCFPWVLDGVDQADLACWGVSTP